MNIEEANRQLGLYRAAVNEIDDLFEYGTVERWQVYEIMARLTDCLVCGWPTLKGSADDFTITPKGREMLKETGNDNR